MQCFCPTAVSSVFRLVVSVSMYESCHCVECTVCMEELVVRIPTVILTLESGVSSSTACAD